MNTKVPRVSSKTTVLEATRIMNEAKSSGVVVFDGDKVVGYLTDRRLLTAFFPLNKRPDEVKVGEVTAPFYRIDPDETTKEAARKVVVHGITRLGVFEGEKFLGWVSLTDLSRHFARKNLIDVLRANNKSETAEFICPKCRATFMEKVTSDDGQIIRWECGKCHYSL